MNALVVGCLAGNFLLLFSIFRYRTRGPRPRDEGSLAFIYALAQTPAKESDRQRRNRFKRGTRSLALLIRHVYDVHDALGLNPVLRYEIANDLLDGYRSRPNRWNLEAYLVACYALDMPSDQTAAELALDSGRLNLVVMAAATMSRRADDRVIGILVQLKLKKNVSLEGAMEVLRRRSQDGMSAAALFQLLQVTNPESLLKLSPLARLLSPMDRRLFLSQNQFASGLRVAAALLREGNEVNDIWFVRERWHSLDGMAKIAYLDRLSFNPLIGRDVADLLSEAVCDDSYEVRIAAGRALKRGFRSKSITRDQLHLFGDRYGQEMVDYALEEARLPEPIPEEAEWTLSCAA